MEPNILQQIMQLVGSMASSRADASSNPEAPSSGAIQQFANTGGMMHNSPFAQLPQLPQQQQQPQPQTDNWKSAQSEVEKLQQGQRDQYGWNFKEHPVKSVLNALAAFGGGVGEAQGIRSPFLDQVRQAQDPQTAINDTAQIAQGRQAGQMQPLTVAHLLAQIQNQQAEAAYKKKEGINRGKEIRSENSYRRGQLQIGRQNANTRAAAVQGTQDYRQASLELKQQLSTLGPADKVTKIKEFMATFGSSPEMEVELAKWQKFAGEQPSTPAGTTKVWGKDF